MIESVPDCSGNILSLCIFILKLTSRFELSNEIRGIECMKKFFTALPVICFLLIFFMLMYLSQGWEMAFFDYLFEISLFTPIFINVLGVISAFFSLKGTTRKVLVLINSLMIVSFGILSFVAIFGFQEP